MKAMFLALTVLSLSLASCKKDYTCECTKESPTGTSTESHNTGKMKLEDARTKCNEGDQTTTILGETYTTECSLK